MSTMIETITTASGLPLRVEKRAAGGHIEISLRTNDKRKCLLHWGIQRADADGWQIAPPAAWPEGTSQFGHDALQTPFVKQNGERGIILKLNAPADFSSINFVLFFPERRHWDNNNGRNYRIEVPKPPRSHAALQQAFKQKLGPGKALFEHVYEVESEGQLAVAVWKEADRFVAILMSDLPGLLILHWGIARYSSYEWFFPPASLHPAGTTIWQGTTQTPFTIRSDALNELRLEFPEAEAPAGVPFVLKQVEPERWLKNGQENFFVPISTAALKATGLEAPELAGIAERITKAEMGGSSWTLMHRFNLCHNLLDQVRHSAQGLALLFVWLRFSAIRQLTWQRNYNTKPRELSHAQDRLTLKLADVYRNVPASRSLVRLMLGAVGRGGEGQRIRDEILAIMHRHRIKEVAGHFMEEWHQKLHNNTTPDDIVICEAYLDFLRSDGNLDRFYQRLQKDNVTEARLKSFERPIRTHPDFLPHLKDALIHDFENFLRVLKSVHAGTDLETALHEARPQLDADTQHLLSQLWHQRNDPRLPLTQLVERITEARRRLRDFLGRPGVRDALYLDLALEASLRGAVERNIHLHLTGDDLVDLIARVLENLLLSEADSELAVCSPHWERLKAAPRFSRDWSLHAKSVLDRVGRVLSAHIDRAYQLLQPKAELLGNAFHAEPWTITLFSEEVVRGSSLGFVLSMLLHHLDPLLRRSAQLGHWQVLSRGSGSGQVETIATLRAIQGRQFDRPTVIIADKVMGDEEVPEGIVAVIAPDVTDIVSHVAVRARNAHLLFATCYDAATFQRLKSLRGRRIRLDVNAAGDVVCTELAVEEILPAAVATRLARILAAKPQFTRYAVAAADFDERIVGGKSFRQTRLRGRLPDWIKQPASVALPFGVFERVLALEQNRLVAGRYTALLGEPESEYATTLPKLRQTLLALTPPRELVVAMREAMVKAALPWPDHWEQAWSCIKRVWASKWNERAFLSRKANGIAHEDLFMAVLIQQVVEAQYAFVIHTINPSTGNPDELYAEVVLGLGETVVGNYPGRALSFTWDKRSGKEMLLAYPGKSVGLYGGGLIFRSDSNGEDLAGYAGAGLYDSVLLHEPRAVVLDYSQERLLWDVEFRQRLLRTIAQAGLAVADATGSPQDVEGVWALGECHVVQTRPQVGVEHA
jgi:alpha-glucan,water dikinase